MIIGCHGNRETIGTCLDKFVKIMILVFLMMLEPTICYQINTCKLHLSLREWYDPCLLVLHRFCFQYISCCHGNQGAKCILWQIMPLYAFFRILSIFANIEVSASDIYPAGICFLSYIKVTWPMLVSII